MFVHVHSLVTPSGRQILAPLAEGYRVRGERLELNRKDIGPISMYVSFLINFLAETSSMKTAVMSALFTTGSLVTSKASYLQEVHNRYLLHEEVPDINLVFISFSSKEIIINKIDVLIG